MVEGLADSFSAQRTDPHELIQVVGETIGAHWCELTIGNLKYEWSGPNPRVTEAARTSLSPDPAISIAIAPASAMLTAQEWQPLLVMLEPLVFTEAAEHTQRLRHEALQRFDDARWRASADMAQKRRRLERDLHDGAQHHLVALQMQIAMAEHQRDDPGDEERLAAVRIQLETAELVLVSTARGVMPEALAAGGLNGALQGLGGPNVSVSASLPRLMPAVESALYFIALEAVSNANKHAAGAHVTIEARMMSGRVTVSIRDDGPGFVVDDESVVGLSHLAKRLEVINGELTIESAPGEGTCVTATVSY